MYFCCMTTFYDFMSRLFLFAAFLLSLSVALSSCGNDESSKGDQPQSQKVAQLFKAVESRSSGLTFTNNVDETAMRNSMFFDYFLNGGGVAVGDINNDGLADIFFTGNDVDNRLYLNKGQLKFEDISDSALPKAKKWSTGANMVDVNQDGFLDIYICNSGMEDQEGRLANQLLINNGDLTFTDRAAEYGIAGNSLSVHSSFFDYDRDGDLDLWVSNHLNFDGDIAKVLVDQSKPHSQRIKYRSILYRNDGDKFVDVSQKAGVSRESVALGVSTTDINGDGWVDIYVSNDYDIPDYYFENNQDGTFTEVSKQKIGHTSFYSMGLDAADINNDGELDMVAVDMTPQDHVRNKVLMASMDSKKFQFLYDQQKLTKAYMFNTVQMGRGDGYMSEVGNYMGVSQTEWSWAPLLADFDNDGYKDLYITNGYLRDTKDNDFKRKVEEYKQQNGGQWSEDVYAYFQKIINSTPVDNRVFRNTGQEFEDVTSQWSDLAPTFSNGAAYADFDNDGDLDIIINNIAQPASLLENISAKRSYLKVKLTGSAVDNARVSIATNQGLQSVDYTFSRGYQSSVQHIAHFGLGDATRVEGIRVRWPDGKEEIFDTDQINTTISLAKGSGASTGGQAPISPYLKDAEVLATSVTHQEMKYDDFAKEILLPHKYSDLGPALAVGDVNGDGDDDIFLGGSNTSEPQMLMTSNGRLVKQTPIAILNDKRYEDLGALFFDMDADGDLDLYVASGGGGEIEKFPELKQDRLYRNDGKGNFQAIPDNLPPITSSTMSIVAVDADQDGDNDLIVGGRNTPGKYPLAAQSYYLENSNGIFRDRSKKVLPELPGMITDISVIASGNSSSDLLLASEWDSPVILRFVDGKYQIHESKSLQNHNGWWQSITAVDLDGDGDEDYVLGNMGQNSKFHPSTKKPLGVLASDFDDSGSLDIVLTKRYHNETVPVRGKECSSQQMPMINDKFPTYEGFATSSIEDILGEGKIDQSYSRSVTDFASYYAINEEGSFTLKKVPAEAQWFPLMDTEVMDVDQDGFQDLVMIGGKHSAEPETPSYDAGRGLVMLGDGKGGYTPVTNTKQSGLNISTDARAIKKASIGGQEVLIIASNNGQLQILKNN